MMRRCLVVLLTLSMIGCSEQNKTQEEITASPYSLEITTNHSTDTSLVSKFNSSVFDDRIPDIKKIQFATVFPEILPEIMVLSCRFGENVPTETVEICYDTIQDRFYNLFNRHFLNHFNEMLEGRFNGDITEEEAFKIAAVVIYIKYKPKGMVCRSADLFLYPRLRSYINKTFTPIPGEQPKEFSTTWWAWSAFPSAQNEYRNLYSTYADSIAANETLRDIPDGTLGFPEVTKKGIYYEVTIIALPPHPENEVVRYRVRVASDGRVHKEKVEVVYYL